ncbi:hypothetical protein [Nocardiopsis sp. NPDC057823]|uniref:hypothetical protein n=1 Tax=Nocardiopsis sp. NPDC057823 TaxID=3346256 RepID=UPI0036730E4E
MQTIDLTAASRRSLPRALAAVLILLTVSAAGCAGLMVYVRPLIDRHLDPAFAGVLGVVTGIAALLLGVFAFGAAGVLVFLLVRAPAFLARQGIRLDPGGLTLYQERSGWSRERSLHIPWGGLAGVGEPANPEARRGFAGSVLHLDGAADAAPPQWAHVVAPGAEPPEGEPVSDAYRVFLQLPEDVARDLPRTVAGYRAAVAPAAAPPPAADGRWFSFRGMRVLGWAVAGFLPALFLTGVLGWSWYDSGDPFLAVPAGAAGAAVLGALAVGPRFWAPQGVRLDARGLSVRRGPGPFLRGTRHFVPWEEVHALTRHERPRGTGTGSARLPVLEVHATGPAPESPLPRWARYVPAGTPGWGTVTDTPRLVLAPADARAASEILHLAERLRPVPASAPVPGPGAVPPRTDVWVELPRRGLQRAVGALGFFLITVLMAVTLGFDLFAEPRMLLFVVLPSVLLAAWALWRLPEAAAGSGILITDDAVELVRNRCLWRSGVRTVVPLSSVTAVRRVRAPSLTGLAGGWPVEDAVDLFVTGNPGRTPHWVRRGRGGEPGTLRLRVMGGPAVLPLTGGVGGRLRPEAGAAPVRSPE